MTPSLVNELPRRAAGAVMSVGEKSKGSSISLLLASFLSVIFNSTGSAGADQDPADAARGPSAPIRWTLLGASGVYLAHFASLYPQLPGLYGEGGLQPVTPDRLADTFLLQWFPPQLGLEFFALSGVLVASAQLARGSLRYGLSGMVCFAVDWILWHDLVKAGGRFTGYQMDYLLLDAAPLMVLAASAVAPAAAAFGFRWLLTRLYLGAGAVKLLSRDASWRDLSAVHWHLQSQPLPNPVGAAAFTALPELVTDAATLGVLVVEMAVPFLFLAPSASVRRAAFAVHVLLMAAIAVFGNFGPLQAALVVFSFALLEEGETSARSDASVDAAAALLAAAATVWTLHEVFTPSDGAWPVAPLVYGALTLGGAAIVADKAAGRMGLVQAATAAMLLVGSAGALTQGLDVALPLGTLLNAFNVGAQPYGLFAVMTGVGGRPVTLIEAASSMDGPWLPVPLRYQVNDPSAPLPLCFPHFPRMDWTLWFIPLGETGRWFSRLLCGILNGEPTILSLIDEAAMRQAFPEGPAFLRVSDVTYTLDTMGHWFATAAPDSIASQAKTVLARSDCVVSGSDAWPPTPLRALSDRLSPELFIWTWFVLASAAASQPGSNAVGLGIPEALELLRAAEADAGASDDRPQQ